VIAHGVARIQNQIQNDKLKLSGVDFNGPRAAPQLKVHVNISTQTVVQKFTHGVDLTVDIDGLYFNGCLREKTGNCLVSAAPRCAACCIPSIRRSKRAESGFRRGNQVVLGVGGDGLTVAVDVERHRMGMRIAAGVPERGPRLVEVRPLQPAAR
jgi:hypothetical protein